REDFAGAGALSQAWAMSDPDRQAMAVDHHGPTVRWGDRRRAHEDVHRVVGDVLETSGPKADLVAALNFSAFVFHGRQNMVRYLRACRRRLRPRGVVVMDLFGGPGARRVQTQTRRIPADRLPGLPAFTYRWVQHAFDEATARIDCRVYFDLPGRPASERPAFRYDWRLWAPAELREAAAEAGFGDVALWTDLPATPGRPGDPRYRPRRRMGDREDFVAYLAARGA
ncbi:MAG: hypothetical protein AAF612_10340, partial [Planctomycetota bacterium]